MQNDIVLRKLLRDDRDSIAGIVQKIPQFTPEEKDCALELADLYITYGESSGYDFLLSVDSDNALAGYICFGRIPLTDACYDIYWMAVDPARQNIGIGTQLLNAAEEKMAGLNARKVFIETSSQEKYLSAQNFYKKNGFKTVSCIKDFYKIGDDKLVYLKEIKSR